MVRLRTNWTQFLIGAVAAVCGAVFVTSVALAHGPTRQKTTEKIEINAPADKVWAVIGNFQDMSWHPAVEKVEGKGDNDADAERTITTTSGGQLFEKLLKYDAEKRMYKYEITDVDVKVLPVKNYSSSLSVAGEGDKSTVTWKGAFYRGFLNNDPPPELNEAAAKSAVSGLYKAGLEALKTKVEGGK